MLELDHLAVAAETLSEGVEYVEDLLGVKTAPGGKHPLMGTHNRLLSLGTGAYLEVIAIDRDAPDPGRARWFELDSFTGPPRLTNWIARTDDLQDAKAQAPAGIGQAVALSRGDLRWQMLVPEDGKLPFGGAYPALISWQGSAHPAALLPASGCTLEGLYIGHPDADNLSGFLDSMPDLKGGSVNLADTARLAATIRTPSGVVELL